MFALISVIVSIIALLVIYVLIAGDGKDAKNASAKDSPAIFFDGTYTNEAYFRYHEQTYSENEGML